MENLINQAKIMAKTIARVSKSCPKNHYTCFYEGENEWTVAHIQKGWQVKQPSISFGANPLTKKEVIEIINRLENGN